MLRIFSISFINYFLLFCFRLRQRSHCNVLHYHLSTFYYHYFISLLFLYLFYHYHLFITSPLFCFLVLPFLLSSYLFLLILHFLFTSLPFPSSCHTNPSLMVSLSPNSILLPPLSYSSTSSSPSHLSLPRFPVTPTCLHKVSSSLSYTCSPPPRFPPAHAKVST